MKSKDVCHVVSRDVMLLIKSLESLSLAVESVCASTKVMIETLADEEAAVAQREASSEDPEKPRTQFSADQPAKVKPAKEVTKEVKKMVKEMMAKSPTHTGTIRKGCRNLKPEE